MKVLFAIPLMLALAAPVAAEVQGTSAPAPAPATASGSAPAAPAMSPDGMVGPALYVSDPARSRAFYVDGLGMTLRASFGPKNKPDMIVGFGRSMFDAGIMLLTDKEAAVPRPIQHVHGFDRIALRVADLRTINTRLQAAGFAAGDIQVVHGAVQMMIVTDPDGYRIEMIDSKPAPRAH